MSYKAIVCRLVNVRPHSKADRLLLATAMGHQVVVSLDKMEGELGIFFPSDGKLSPRMLYENSLYSNPEMNKNELSKGYFGRDGRVKAQNFRQEKSEGFWVELSSVAWSGVKEEELIEGLQFTHLNGEEICSKYVNPATLRHARRHNKKRDKKAQRRLFEMLKEHFDTPQLRYEINRILPGSILYLTEKVHGTSGRTGHILAEESCKGLRWWIYQKTGWFKPKMTWQVITGTRRVVLDPDQQVDKGYYSGKTFRLQIHEVFKELGIPKGMTFFYEIVGFTEDMSLIMPRQPIEKIDDKKLRKEVKTLYGDEMVFAYGCGPSRPYRVMVYRITMTSEDGHIFELPWAQVKDICQKYGLETVPELSKMLVYDQDTSLLDSFCSEYWGEDVGLSERARLMKYVENYLDRPSSLDRSHIREGVCIRAEMPNGQMLIMKDKGFLFKLLEGIVKTNENVVDIEEVESIVVEEATR